MTIKDFKVGQTAYILGDRRGKGADLATEAEVIKVGRKYVTVAPGARREIRFLEPYTETAFLVEDKDYGVKRLLFPTAEAVDEYNELNNLRSWAQKATDWTKIKEYTIDQLRAVKKILEEADHGGMAQESGQGD